MSGKPKSRNRLNGAELCEPRYLLSGNSELGAAEPSQDVVAEFSLLDVNPTSQTYDQLVSPSDFRGQVSAWYFGFAT